MYLYIKTSDSVAHHIFRLEKAARGKDEVEHHWSELICLE